MCFGDPPADTRILLPVVTLQQLKNGKSAVSLVDAPLWKSIILFPKVRKFLYLCQQFLFSCLQKLEPVPFFFTLYFFLAPVTLCLNQLLPWKNSDFCRFQGTVGTVIVRRVCKLDEMLQASPLFCSKFLMNLVNLIFIKQWSLE